MIRCVESRDKGLRDNNNVTNIFRKLKLEINPILPQNITNMTGAFRYWWAIIYSLLVAQPIRTQHR